MESRKDPEEIIKQFLLGKLSEAQEEQISEQLLKDEALYAQLLSQEEKLIEDYLGDRLSEEDRAHFERYFLCTFDRRQSLAVIKALQKYPSYMSTHNRKRKLFQQWWSLPVEGIVQWLRSYGLTLGICFIIIVLGIWGCHLLTRVSRLERQLRYLKEQQSVCGESPCDAYILSSS